MRIIFAVIALSFLAFWQAAPSGLGVAVIPLPLADLQSPQQSGDVICGSGGQWADCQQAMTERNVAGASDAIVASDRLNIVTYSGTSAVAVALPAAALLGSNFAFHVEVSCTGAPTFTPAAGTINGAASFTAPVNSVGLIYSRDNVNWVADFMSAYLWSCH